MSKNVTIISISMPDDMVRRLAEVVKKSPFSRSSLICYAVCQQLGIPYDPPRKIEGDKDDE